jgi:hypothetical protein
MLIVKIYVNATPVREGYAVRIKGDTNPDSINTYQLHDGSIVKHRYGDGATKLAKKILKKVKP